MQILSYHNRDSILVFSAVFRKENISEEYTCRPDESAEVP